MRGAARRPRGWSAFTGRRRPARPAPRRPMRRARPWSRLPPHGPSRRRGRRRARPPSRRAATRDRRRPRARRRRPRRRCPALVRKDSTVGSSPSSRSGCRGDRRADRVLRGVLEGAREPQQLGAVHARRRHDIDQRHPPVVTVPVLSSTMVSTARVDSRISGPLIRMPSWAPRPVPTSSAVGVASPSAHGQAMMRTATAAVTAAAAG